MWLNNIWLHRYRTELPRKTIHCCPPDIPVNGGCGKWLQIPLSDDSEASESWQTLTPGPILPPKLEMHRKAGFVHQESFPEGGSLHLPQQLNPQLWKGCDETLFIWEMLLFLVDWQFLPWNIKQNVASKCSKMRICQKYFGLYFSLKRNVSFLLHIFEL